MATKIHYFTGIAKWAKLRVPDEEYKNYTIDLYMDDASWAEFKKSGMSNKPRTSEDGSFITFRRPEAKLIKGELVKFGPPTVINAEEKPIDDLIGNGSAVTVKVVVYDTVKGKGSRLEAVRVDKLIPYVPNTGFPKAPTAATAAAATPAPAPAAGQPPF